MVSTPHRHARPCMSLLPKKFHTITPDRPRYRIAPARSNLCRLGCMGSNSSSGLLTPILTTMVSITDKGTRFAELRAYGSTSRPFRGLNYGCP
ncbi:hypothetical protein DL93DRAFT_2076513 [Clavulina sp. PMI_390]|nr:hypothetical protein DL93DRAFT_2076513 [Clavulina sp. PMI_390]